MKDKISYAFKKSKFVLIILIILWLVLSIVLIAPLSISWVDAVTKGNGNFINNLLSSNLGDIGGNLGKAFSHEYIGTFLKCDLWLMIILMGFAIVGIIKTQNQQKYFEEYKKSIHGLKTDLSIIFKSKISLKKKVYYFCMAICPVLIAKLAVAKERKFNEKYKVG